MIHWLVEGRAAIQWILKLLMTVMKETGETSLA